MLEPKDMTPEELRRKGLGLIERESAPGISVRRAYCLRCGGQVASERRDSDPNGWWICARGCNTRFASSAPYPTDLPLPDARSIRGRFDSR
jgi:hypothetical protein